MGDPAQSSVQAVLIDHEEQIAILNRLEQPRVYEQPRHYTEGSADRVAHDFFGP